MCIMLKKKKITDWVRNDIFDTVYQKLQSEYIHYSGHPPCVHTTTIVAVCMSLWEI